MKPICKYLISFALSAAMLTGTAIIAVPAAETEYSQTAAVSVQVSASDIDNLGPCIAIQNALDEARDHATDSNPYTVVVPEGVYPMDNLLRIYDNTTLDMRGVTFVHQSTTNIIKVGAKDTNEEGVDGYYYRNIRLLGGTLDGNGEGNTLIKVFHASNFTMEGVTLCNEHNGHMVEVAGVDGFTVRDCTFRDQILDPGEFGYEVIQLDVLYPFHIYEAHAEALNMKNVLIENCTFDNVPRGIGSHTAVLNNFHDNITIRNNSFTNIKSVAIQGMGWKNVNITGNYIDNAPRGIAVYSVMYRGRGTYLASDFYNIGQVESDKTISEDYISPKNTNINIAYNELYNIGTFDDIYASYKCHGISVLGSNLDKAYPKETDDGSAGLPVGNYYNDVVNIHDNFVDVRGNGVYIEDGRNVNIKANVLQCGKNTVHPATYTGIQLRLNTQANQICNNTIIKSEYDGIQLHTSTAKTISGNRIESPGKYGISSYFGTVTSITNNDIISAKAQGIPIMDASKVTDIKNNRIRKCAKQGIYITANSAAGNVSGNTITDCGGNIYYYKSKNLVKVGSNSTTPATLTKFNLEQDGVIMGVGTAYKIVPDVKPVNTFSSFTYNSSNSSVASVDKYGRIKAVSPGSANIKVTSDNGVSRKYPVTVNNGSTVTFVVPEPTATPAISSLTTTEKGVRIQWNAVDGAKGYRIYRKGATDWVGLANVTATEYIDSNVTPGTTYTYTLRSLDNNDNVISDFNRTGWKYTYTLATPRITSVTSNNSGIVISWSKITGAYGYRVFYQNGSSWVKLGTTTGTSFTDTKFTPGVSRTYTVRCVDKQDKYISDYDHTGVSGVFIATPSVTSVTSTSDGVVLKWNPCGGAYGYRVFVKNNSGSWERIATTTATTYTDNTVVSGNTYIYTVRCIDRNDSYVSDFNHSGYKITYADTPQVNNISVSSSGVTLKWNAIRGANAYRVFYVNNKGAWTRLGTVSGTSFTDAKIMPGDTRVYTVRCVNANDSYISDFNRVGFTATYYRTPDFKLANEAEGVRVSWTAEPGVDSYRVYHRVNNSWTAVATVQGGSYLDTGLTAGSAYTYTVRGVGANGYPDSFATGYLGAGRSITFRPPEIAATAQEDPTEDMIPE